MRITFICHYFPPEIGAPSARIYEMAKRWVKEGHEVKVVTCFPNHPTGTIPKEYKGLKYHKEEMDGITIHRNYVYATPNKGFIKKTIGHISFMISSVLFSLKKIGDTDIVITSSPTFFSIISGYYISKRKKVPFILEIRDLWPAAIVELGVLKNKLIINLLERLELRYYRKSSKLVMVTNAFKLNLIERGIYKDKIEVITNGYEVEMFFPQEKDLELVEKYGLEDKFIVEYVGVHGISQALDKIILVAEQLTDKKDIQFVFIGEGADKEKLQQMVAEKKLLNVLFIDAQPKEKIPRFYNIADICLVPLKNIPLFKTFIPSKMFEIMGCGIPIIASLEGEAADILRQSQAAVIVSPEDITGIKDSIIKLKNDKILRENMSKSGIKFVKQYYSRELLAKKYLLLIEQTIKESKK
jgi:glycosyltransferase involved in cell wall biosynthesis